MKTETQTDITELTHIADFIIKNNTLPMTQFEALQIACTIQRNRIESDRTEIFRRAFNISLSDKYPGALEAIAIQLGFEIDGNINIIDAISNLKQE